MTTARRTLLARLDSLRAAVASGKLDTVIAIAVGRDEDAILIGGESQSDDEWDGAVARLIEVIEEARTESGGVN